MRMEATAGDLHKARVEREFIRLVRDRLPVEARDHLTHVPDGEEESWARQWGLNAPCILRVVNLWRDGYDVDSYEGQDVSNRWQAELRRLNAEPPNATLWKNAKEDNRLATAPIGANPFVETFDEFLQRSKNHWKARVATAKRCGLVPAFDVRKWREFQRNLDWLIRYQIEKVDFESIAANPGHGFRVCSKGAVEKAVRRVARVLQLPLREVQRGGYRRHRSAN